MVAFFFALVALMNLALGFGLALAVGRGPRVPIVDGLSILHDEMSSVLWSARRSLPRFRKVSESALRTSDPASTASDATLEATPESSLPTPRTTDTAVAEENALGDCPEERPHALD